MGGKNRAKKLAGGQGATTTKKSSSVKVGNKQSNKAKARAGVKLSESLGKKPGALSEKKKEKKEAKKSNAGAGGSKDGQTAESRKKAKRSHGAKAGGVSVKQQKQHAHEPHAMSRHDAAYNQRAQEKADRLAGKLTPAEEGLKLQAEAAAADPEANEADARYFEKNAGRMGFLTNLNENDLKGSKEDREKKKPRFPQPAPGSLKRKASELSDDEDGDEDDMSMDEEDDDEEDEEDDDDDDEDMDVPKPKKTAVSISALENRPRVPGWLKNQNIGAPASKSAAGAKDRMPVRNADGSWGDSAVSKADQLRARAEKLESEENKRLLARAQGLEEKQQQSEEEEEEDVEMEDTEADADEEDQEDDEDEQFDDSIPFSGIAADEGADDDEDEDAELEAGEDDEEDFDDELEVEEVGANVGKPKNASITSAAVQLQQERRQFQLKSELAENSELILENPEKNIGKLEPMLQLCTDVDLTIQQIAMMSCVEVLVDLMPTYRIRLPTTEESEMNLSKEVKATWKFERQYLLYYGRLVTLLITYIKRVFPPSTNDRVSVSTLGRNLLRCACKLLEKGYAFNYRKELIHTLSPFLNHISPPTRTLLFQTLVSIFRADIAGESTLEIVKLLTKIVKEKGRRCQVEVLQIFLYLPLHKDILEAKTGDDADGKKGGKAEPHSKKKKHIVVDEKELGRDLAESEAVVSLATRKKIQTQLLTELFTAYFRILKQQKNSRLLPTVLKGLSKFATLIDIEIVLDLLDCLKATISVENEEPLSLESALYCILTSFSTLHSHGQALAMDLKEFYNCLYARLMTFTDPAEVKHVPLLLQCLHLMFHETKQLSIERVASFVKRLSTICLYVPPYACLAILHALRLCLNKYPRVKQLLDREATASGIHLAEMDDPDLANSFASTAWELGLLKQSYHPFIPVYSSSILTDESLPLSLQRTTPLDLFENYDSSEGGFNPPLPLPIMFSSAGAGGGAPTSTSMKKKLDLKRRILVQHLSASQKLSQFQSEFLRGVTQVAVNARKEESEGEWQERKGRTRDEMKEYLQQLQAIAQKFKQHRQQQRSGSSSSSAMKSQKQQNGASTQLGNGHVKTSNGQQPQLKKQKR